MGVFNPHTFLPNFLPAAPFSDHQITHLLNPDTTTTTISSSSPPPQPLPEFSPFKPSIAIVLGLLTTIFSIIFLLLLYAIRCKRNRNSDNYRPGYTPSAAARINSGIDRAVIESLPIFRFGSLSGDKDGLECSVCLTKFEITEVLRLLPKCKHAFHVECVDTWLDAHSTCPLCRYRVDPEDILLIGDAQFLQQIPDPIHPISDPIPDPESKFQTQRISGRHSSAGELQIGKIGSRVGESEFSGNPGSTRRSLDSFKVRYSDRSRKDGLLLSERRLKHRIIVSSGGNRMLLPQQQRWSDVQPSDLLHLRSEMIINDSQRRLFPWARKTGQQQRKREKNEEEEEEGGGGDGRNAIKTRSVSEIMGLSRLSFSGSGNQQRRERGGILPRWSDVGSGRTAIGGC